MKLYRNGKFIVEEDGQVFSGEYKIEGNKLTLMTGIGLGVVCRYEKNRIIDNEGGVWLKANKKKLISYSNNELNSYKPQFDRNQIELQVIETKWVVKEYVADPPKLVLVPNISFRIRNVGNRPLEGLEFSGIFRFKGEIKNLGDSYIIAKTPIKPGDLSPVFSLKSNYGVEGKNINSFKNNPNWKPVVVNLNVRTSGTEYVLLGEYEITRQIDFKNDKK